MDLGDVSLLGPPLDILPRSIEPAELQAYRADYQAFRAGQALGARGEISALCPTREEGPEATAGWPPSPGAAAASAAAGPGGSGALAAASGVVNRTSSGGLGGEGGSDVEAYYSEPERDTHALAFSPDGVAILRVVGARRRQVLDDPCVATVEELQRGRATATARVPRGSGACAGRGGRVQTSSSSSLSTQRGLRHRTPRAVSVLRPPEEAFWSPVGAFASPASPARRALDLLGVGADSPLASHPLGSEHPGPVVAGVAGAAVQAGCTAASAIGRLADSPCGGAVTSASGIDLVSEVAAPQPVRAPLPHAPPLETAAPALPRCSIIKVGAAAGVAEAVAIAAPASASAAVPSIAPREHARLPPRPDVNFAAWLVDEVQSRPDEAQLLKAPRSHLNEVAKVPPRLEKLLGFGFFLCLDILLHELSFTPLQAAWSVSRLVLGRKRSSCATPSTTPTASAPPLLTVTEQGDVLRLSLLFLNVALMSVLVDDSMLYHYIRTESFLKLYVVFNMLEMFERWCRSVGADLFDLLAASARQPYHRLAPRAAAALVYCFLHSTMHMLRVLLLHVAIHTSSSAVFLIIVTNNFGEIKSSVFKKYTLESLFPIVTSDIVERFYLVFDILVVLARLNISARRGAVAWADVMWWLTLLVVIEVGTDWVKFCLIFKFSDLRASTLETYQEVLIADILLCRSGGAAEIDRLFAASATVVPRTPSGGSAPQPQAHATAPQHHLPPQAVPQAQAPQRPPTQPPQAGPGAVGPKDARPPRVPLRGLHSFSHSLARRIGFCGVPFSSLVVLQTLALLRSPCSLALGMNRATVLAALALAGVLLALLAKVLLAATLLGCAARRRSRIQKGLELFTRIKAL